MYIFIRALPTERRFDLHMRILFMAMRCKCEAHVLQVCRKCAKCTALCARCKCVPNVCKYTSNALQVRRTCATSVPQVRCEFAARAHHVSALLEHAGTQLAARLPRVRAWGRHGRRRVLKRSGRACPPLSLSCVLQLGRQAYTSQAPCSQPAPQRDFGPSQANEFVL